MSELIKKSKENAKSAVLLKSAQCYSSVIHCAYYSCFQLIKHFFLEYVEHDEEKLKVNISTSKQGSHVYITNLLMKEISNNIAVNSAEKSKIYSLLGEINKLKAMRNEADYSHKIINETFANRAISISTTVNKQIDNTFSNGKVQ